MRPNRTSLASSHTPPIVSAGSKPGVYKTTLTAALAALHDGPEIRGCVARDDIRPGLRTLHVARRGRRGRHFVMFRVVSDPAGGELIEVVRILHDAMDLAQHVPPDV